MPLLIPRDAQALWLDPRTSVEEVLKLAERPPALEVLPSDSASTTRATTTTA